MHDIVNLLRAVVATMDTISVVGIENQNRFVGCANAVRSAATQLEMLEKKGGSDTDG